jgi:hypothetical protein
MTTSKPTGSSQAQPATAAAQAPVAPAQQVNALMLSPDDLQNLIDAVAKTVVRMQHLPAGTQTGSGKVLVVDVPNTKPARQLRIPVPATYATLPDNDPRIVSMVMSAINADGYRAGDFRAFADPTITGTVTRSGVQLKIQSSP